jgi:putative hydrolase of the HAD superfamily
MTIQAVFFDMGGTIETFNYTREFRLKAIPGLQQQLAAAGINLQLTGEQLLDVISRGLKRYHQWRMQSLQELPSWQIWCEYILSDFPASWQSLRSISEELMMYYESSFYLRKMRPEIPVVLEAIQQMGLKIGLISNVCSRGLVPANLVHYRLGHYFDPIVLSSEYGRRKPDPAIFHYAARLANVPTSQCAYVGDRISRDVVGARKAGYRLAVQIRHDFEHGEPDDGAVPDAIIDDMTELLAILHKECTQHPATTMLETIRAILFDAGDILYHRPQREQQFKIFLNKLSFDQGDRHTVERNELAHQAYQGLISQDQYREAIVRMYGVTKPEHIEQGKQILAMEDDNVHFFAGVSQTLAALKEMGYMLGVVTDTASPLHVKLKWFEQGGFGAVWDSVISSKEMGIRKPDPRIYQAALKQLGLTSKQAVFVGHKASELAGARAIGLQTIAFNFEKSAKADYFIEKFADLLNVPLIVPSLLASTG